MDHVLIVGGGKDSSLVVEKVHEIGLRALVVDIDPEAPGALKADRTLRASTHEHLPLLEELRCMAQQGVHVAAVVTRSSGTPVLTTARIAEALDLPGASVGAATTLTTKLGLSKLCRESGILETDAVQVDQGSASELAGGRLPCVIKPNLGHVGKRGVTLVSRPSSVEDAVQRAHEASVDGTVIMERYVPGVDLSLISMVCAGRLYPCFVLEEMNRFDDRGEVVCRGFRLLDPGNDHHRAALTTVAQKIVTAAGVDYSPFLLSCRVANDHQPIPVEVNLDFGGEQVLDSLLPLSTDFDFVKCFLQSLVSRQRPEISITYHG